MIKPLIRIINNFLWWLEEHQIGILTTIAVHLLIISVILVLKIKTNAQLEYSILVDLSQIQEMMDEIPPEILQQESAQEFVQNMQQQYNVVRNIPVNVAEERAVQNIERMIRDIKAQENITDLPPPQDTPAEIAPREEKLAENEARIYEDRYPLNASGERTIYTGATTVSYELSGRRHISMPAPAYKCRMAGTIVVDIVVTNNGYVHKAEINKSKSNSEDPCHIEEAIRVAERSRFDQSPLARQQGSITYIFLAQ